MRTCKPIDLITHIITTLNAGLTPAIWGPPGIGKSDIMRQVTAMLGLYLIDLRLSQMEPTDLNGIPDRQDGRLIWLPPLTIPLEDDPIPEGYKGFLLFLDEANSAGQEMQKAAYKLILDRMIGQYRLHPQCYMAVAGNLMTDRALVNKMPTTLQSRMVHFNLIPDVDEWLLWAERNDIDQRILGYIRFAPDSLHDFDPRTEDNTFPCPRTWEFNSRLIKEMNSLPLVLIAGTIGEGTAVKFCEFVETFSELPDFKTVLATPKTAKIVENAAIVYALFSMMISKINANNAASLMTYAQRYPMEYQYFMVRYMRNLRDKAKTALNVPGNDLIYMRLVDAMRTDAVIAWMEKYKDTML